MISRRNFLAASITASMDGSIDNRSYWPVIYNIIGSSVARYLREVEDVSHSAYEPYPTEVATPIQQGRPRQGGSTPN
jgi:hypothetical protein